MSGARFARPRALLTMIAGYLVWSSCFVALYALLSVGCELGLQRHPGLAGINPITLVLAAVWLLHLAALGGLIRAAWRKARIETEPSAFLRWVTLLLHFTALGATLWVGFPLLVLPPCG